MSKKLPGIALLAFFACSSPVPSSGQGSQSVPQKQGLDRFVRIFDTKTGEEILLETLARRLAAMDAVFLGETHLDETTHEVEREVYRRLIETSGKKVVLAMEMFTTADQPALDAYLSGKIDEKTFRSRAMVWGNYQTGYRPLIELAKARRLPVVGSNIPASLRHKIGRGKKKAWNALTQEERALVPEQLYPNSKAYWKRFNRVVGGHMTGFDKVEDPSAEKYLYFGQSLWDNTMGWSCARALARHPGGMVLHVNGGFHSMFRQGTVQQFRRRAPKARVATVNISSAAVLSGIPASKAHEVADYEVFTKRRGWGLDEGMNAVHTTRRLRFKISVPASARKGQKLPLLIWLSGDGYRADDGLRYWKLALGDQAAVLSVEAPYPQVEEDFRIGGRWFWNESYQKDLNETMLALEEIRRYALDFWPVDPDRILFAGIGTGATTLAAAGLYNESLPDQVIAIHPAHEARLRERGIPDKAPEGTRFVVYPTPDRTSWWKSLIGSFNKEGYAAQVATLKVPDGAGTDLMQRIEYQIRTRLSIGNENIDTLAVERHYVLVQDSDNPIASYWALLHKRALEKKGITVTLTDLAGLPSMLGSQLPIPPTVRILGFEGEPWVAKAQALAEGSRAIGVAGLSKSAIIPPAKGPFGGTTILVLPKGLSPSAKKAWQSVEKTNPLRFRGRFYRLRLAYSDAKPGLAEVMADCKSKGRHNLLIVPATYCWDGDQMRALKKSAGPLPSGLSLTWMPGLGAEIYKRAQN